MAARTSGHAGRGPSRAARAVGVLAVLIACLAPASAPAHATVVRPLNIEQLASKAGRIVEGRCVSVVESEHPRLHIPILRVTLDVERTFKGPAARRITFSMYGRLSESGGGEVPGASRFVPGENVILFLYPESRAGLTSPVGFGQGKFVRVPGKDGLEHVVNGLGNRGLFENLSEGARGKLGAAAGRAKGRADLPREELEQAIEELSR